MAIAQMEEIVTTVKAILKTLECPICLDLLKTPVSAGCGHFFCRECVSGILQSTYRAPCPLCKRSFTRRSIQEALQRQSVISAAKILASTCTNLTGVQFYGNESSLKDFEKSDDAAVSTPPKKLKVSKPENEDVPSRKRKSCENEGYIKSSDYENTSEKELNECSKENLQNDHLSPNKRLCPDSDENDSEDLPRLEDIFSSMAKSRNSSTSLKNEKVIEKPLTMFPTDKTSSIKTYSSIHKKTHKSNLSRASSDDASKTVSFLGKNVKNISKEVSEVKTGSVSKNTDSVVQAKNKVNALKNKTNEVLPESNVIQNDSVVKTKSGNKAAKDDDVNKLKENSLCPSPKKKIDKLRRKSQTKLQNADANLLSKCPSNEIISKDNVVSNEEAKNVKSSSPRKNRDYNEVHTLNQVTLLHSQNVNENKECSKTETITKKQTDDSFNVIGLTDTAVSVDAVASPLATKNLSLSKSPGWSRVRKVKRDFKMKKFTSLHVEKNSPNTSNKSATSDQETISAIKKTDNSFDDDDVQRKDDERALDFTNDDEMDIAAKSSVLAPLNRTDEIIAGLDNNKNQLVDDVLNSENAINNKNQLIDDDMNSENAVNNKSEKPNLNFELMDCNENGENNCISESNTNLNEISALKVMPSVSITSNSLICTKFTDAHDKISSHNVLKSQKIVCELKPASPKSDLTTQNDNLFSKYIQEKGLNKKDSKRLFFSNPTDLKQVPFSLPTPFSDYQSFHTQAIESNDNLQYVEQSQQTSQIFNMDFPNAFCDNIRAVVPHQPPLLVCPSSEKTKVVKRTCLTLEEIQDCFLKSSQSGSSETLCSVPFFSGLFKLHIGVADETLNISVLKVLDPTSEINNPPNATSVFSDKGIQASSSLFPMSEVVPSSNAESESSQPDSALDPFPYLNKESATNLEKPMEVISEHPEETALPLTKPNLDNKIFTMHDDTASPVAESFVENDHPAETSHNEDDLDHNCMNEDDLNRSEIIHFPPNPTDKDNTDKRVSKSPESDPLLKTCEEPPPEANQDVTECSVFLEKIDSHDALKCPPESGNNKQSLPDAVNICFENDLSKVEKNSGNNSLNKSNSSKSELIAFDDSSSSDEDESLKKLQQCIKKEQTPTEKKLSRLSLKKKKSSFKRIQLQESSDESDLEISLPSEKLPEDVKKDIFAKPENPSKFVSVPENFSSLRDLNNGNNSKKGVYSSAPAEMPSTFSSTLSEDTTDANASDIILEIEDLSDKIKSLEEKLKLCGHGESKHNKADSDSEDSIDLFPQSVPPTPPNKM